MHGLNSLRRQITQIINTVLSKEFETILPRLSPHLTQIRFIQAENKLVVR
ncbi:hypothetical protein HTG_04520 [Natrinema mahii]|nr:hypothetical protein HTG_04520 [Natrinema mahii]